MHEIGLEYKQINDFVKWNYLDTKRQKLLSKLEKENTEKEKEKLNDNLKKINKKIEKIDQTYVDKFRKIKYPKKRRRSSRITAKTLANINESLIMDNDTDKLQQFENILNVSNVDSSVLQYDKGMYIYQISIKFRLTLILIFLYIMLCQTNLIYT